MQPECKQGNQNAVNLAVDLVIFRLARQAVRAVVDGRGSLIVAPDWQPVR